ncbi:MAG: hypothetical protein JWL69_1281 [Phycisphaerales bacterium]|nr:hypothetical protein [Phycisphaerales bacterium]
MESEIQSTGQPVWVRAGLWGLPSRPLALAFVWLSIICAVACGVYGFWDGRFFWGVGLVLAAIWYWLAIRWVDRHGSWK